MPTYDYLCEACGHELEIFQGINDEPESKCPECKKKKLKRQFGTGAAIVFKGSGFYQTDYRSESYKKGAKADAKKSDSGSGSDKSKSKDSTASKPAKKAD
ncbi:MULTISPECIES: FmdB family zinc ribbon protein [Pirellulaceae]|uniref:Putative FmdB family regulatory protein n=1 Tax=Aporhodopirellula rubra TaxID=980271 RepID=A0A7W5E3P5_9BACT|nr:MULTISPECIES: FmdB family zinc ribbon protein [Pirellulaceae]EMI43988.1 Regulatory protein, FmdB, putative domain protein [Rhodopirellula sp. SWK7]MBB3209626.1 putative FmdB family regulatory protein [Aporhodopirellula rubra]